MRMLVLNGRFLGRPVTGVERMALELTRAISQEIEERAPEAVVQVALPPGTAIHPEGLSRLEGCPLSFTTVGHRSGHAWEQTELAGLQPESWLLNLCNTAPMVRRRQAVVICDAQFILHPEAYSRAFRWWYRILLSIVSRRSAAVFTISEFSKIQLERYGVVPKGKLKTLRLGVDHLLPVDPDDTILVRHGLERPYILAIGSLAHHKNLPFLIEAFSAAGMAEVDLVIAGGGYARVFADAGLPVAKNVQYLGRVTDAELKALYGRALAFACPSLSEGFGLPPLEAMTTGCPVVATTGGAVPEVCGDAALYADPTDQAAWSAALRRIVEDKELRATLGTRARARASQYVWRETARQLLAELRD